MCQVVANGFFSFYKGKLHYFPIVIVRRRRGILNRELLVPESETMPIYLEYLICSVLYREKVEFRRRGAVEFQTRYTVELDFS